jgi:hypothetical protein
MVGGARRPLPQGGEPFGGAGADGQQVHPAVRHIGDGRPGARGLPVDHPGNGAPPPQHVARVEVPVQQHRWKAGLRALADLRGPLPHARVSCPARRPVAGLPVRGERAQFYRRRQRGGVDARRHLRQPGQPPVQVRWPPVDPSGQPRHEHGGHARLGSGGVDRQQRGGGHAGGFGNAQRPCLPPGSIGFLLAALRPHVAAQHRLPAMTGTVLDGEQVHGRGHPAAKGPGGDHRPAQAGGGPGQRLRRWPGAEQSPGLLIVAEPVRG